LRWVGSIGGVCDEYSTYSVFRSKKNYQSRAKNCYTKPLAIHSK
jgi:hypothetical protein